MPTRIRITKTTVNFTRMIGNIKPKRSLVAALENKVRAEVNLEKERLLDEFMNNPITQEINAGPDSSDISGVTRGKGNLFSFIGFPVGSNPIAPLFNLLTTSIGFNRITKIKPSLTAAQRLAMPFEFSLTTPSDTEIENYSSVPWIPHRSWVAGIEDGSIGGFDKYLFRRFIKNKDLKESLEKWFASGGSRSGEGIELAVKGGRGGGIKSTDYLNALLKKFRSKFER